MKKYKPNFNLSTFAALSLLISFSSFAFSDYICDDIGNKVDVEFDSCTAKSTLEYGTNFKTKQKCDQVYQVFSYDGHSTEGVGQTCAINSYRKFKVQCQKCYLNPRVDLGEIEEEQLLEVK